MLYTSLVPLKNGVKAIRIQSNQPVRPRDRVLDGRRSANYAEPPGNSVPVNNGPNRWVYDENWPTIYSISSPSRSLK